MKVASQRDQILRTKKHKNKKQENKKTHSTPPQKLKQKTTTTTKKKQKQKQKQKITDENKRGSNSYKTHVWLFKILD